jgi:transposase
MLQNSEFYRDPGADYYTRRDPAKTRARAVRQLEALGYQITIQRPLATSTANHAVSRLACH